MDPEDLHALPPERFYEHVHSFEFWFGAVQGYLEGREFGHRPETAEAPLDDAARDRLVTVLSHYCLGETAALEGSSGLVRVAPNRPTKVFLSTQTVDEGRHLEVLTHRLVELGVSDPEAEIARRATPALTTFRRRLLELVDARDWEAALFAQNVVLEAMEFAAFHRHARTADPVTREVLMGIIKDERRHIGFGENELGRRIAREPALRERLRPVRQELDALVLESFEHTMRLLDAPVTEHADLGRDYLAAVERLGFA